MARDTNLQLASSKTHAAGTEYSDVVDTEGGFRADIEIQVGDITTTSDTVDIKVQASIDGGSNYFDIASFPQLNDAQDEELYIARPCFIPKPASGQTVTKVRYEIVVSAGGTCEVDWAFVAPQTSVAPPDIDVTQAVGLAALT